MVGHLAPPIQWRCCKKQRSYPHQSAVDSCHSLAREKFAIQGWFDDSDISVERDKPHIQDRGNTQSKLVWIACLKLAPLLAKNPIPCIQACYPKRHVQWCHRNVSQCQVVDEYIRYTLKSGIFIDKTQTTNKLPRMEVRQIRIDKVTSKRISVGERPSESWVIDPLWELSAILWFSSPQNLHIHKI